MLISKKKHNRLMNHMIMVELKLLRKIEILENKLEYTERLNPDELIEHQVNKYYARVYGGNDEGN